MNVFLYFETVTKDKVYTTLDRIVAVRNSEVEANEQVISEVYLQGFHMPLYVDPLIADKIGHLMRTSSSYVAIVNDSLDPATLRKKE